jgi:hypothetical protein
VKSSKVNRIASFDRENNVKDLFLEEKDLLMKEEL